MKRVCTVWLLLASQLKICIAGYRVVYAEDSCRKNKSVSYELGYDGHSTAMIIKATRHPPYAAGMNCSIVITAKIRKGHILLSVRTLDFDNPKACRNYVKIVEDQKVHVLCERYHKDAEDITFTNRSSDSIAFQYHTTTTNSLHTGFEVVATAYRNGTCRRNFDFRCANRNCVSSNLTCDGHNNCGDASDESKDYLSKCGLSRGAIAGITIAVLALIAISIGGILWLGRKRAGNRIRQNPQKTSLVESPTGLCQQSAGSSVNSTYGTHANEYRN